MTTLWNTTGAALARLASASALTLLGAWLIGRLFSDSWHWSQYLYWLPTYTVLAGALALLAVSGLLARWCRRKGGAPSAVAAKSRRFGLAACLGVFAFLLLWEWRVHRFILDAGPPRSSAAQPVRVLAWNPAVAVVPDFTGTVLAPGADVVAITNAPWQTDWTGVREAMAPSYAARFDRFRVVSRFPILRWGGTGLAVQGAKRRVMKWEGGGVISIDKGSAMFVELAVPRLPGGVLTIWMIDMPSDPELFRGRTMREAAAMIRSFRGPIYERNAEGLDDQVPIAPGQEGFPAPDLIVGDFNTPRGSRSMRAIAGGAVHAFDQSGRGPAATWPDRWPILAIDQAFVGSSVRASRYDIVHLGAGAHRAQIIELVPR